MINPALKKRFNLLCPPEQRGDFGWWAYRVIYFAPYRVCGLPPKIKDKDARKAMYAYARDLVQHYAPAKKLSCGHRSRGSYCCTCANRNAAAAQLSMLNHVDSQAQKIADQAKEIEKLKANRSLVPLDSEHERLR